MYWTLNSAVQSFHPFLLIMGLVYRQSSLNHQDLNFQFKELSKSGRTISDKRIINVLYLKEVHLEHAHFSLREVSFFTGRGAPENCGGSGTFS